MLFRALSPCNHTLPSGTRTRRVVILKFLPLDTGTSITSPPSPTARLNTNCSGFVGDVASTTSPRHVGRPASALARSTTTTSPIGLNVGIMLGPTHSVRSATYVFTAVTTTATLAICVRARAHQSVSRAHPSRAKRSLASTPPARSTHRRRARSRLVAKPSPERAHARAPSPARARVRRQRAGRAGRVGVGVCTRTPSVTVCESTRTPS